MSATKVIDIRNNKIEALPDEIGKLPHLTTLKLDFNMLKTLPEHLGLNSKLEILTFSKNSIKRLPEDISGWATNLHLLHMNDNKLD